MANEISTAQLSGIALYAVLRNASVQVWNTQSTAFETYTSGNYSQYAITLAEQGQTGFYAASFPTQITTAGRYSVDVRQRLSGSPLASDTPLGGGVLLWGGSGLGEVDVLANADKSSYGVGSYASGQDPGTFVLRTPANKLLSDSGGRVTVAGYAAGQDPASLVLATAQNKLLTNGSGQVQQDLSQAVPTSNAAQTVGDALNGARAQAFGAWHLDGTTLRLYAADGTTVVRTFQLDNILTPTQRT